MLLSFLVCFCAPLLIVSFVYDMLLLFGFCFSVSTGKNEERTRLLVKCVVDSFSFPFPSTLRG